MAHNNIINLAEFDQDILRPALTDFVKANSNRARAYGFANMVAAYFWMVLGLEADYFPADHARSLFGQRFHEFFGHFEDLFRTCGHLFDPEFAPLLQTAITHRALSPRQEDLRVFKHEISSGTLRTSLLAESRFFREREGNAFVSVLNFEPELLDQIIEHNYALKSIADVVLDRDALARGFESVWTYMETLIELSRTLRQDNEALGERLDRRLRQLTRWRVNKHLGVDEYFLKVALFVNKYYCGGILDETHVEHRVEDILDKWGFTHSKVAGGHG
jgi:hypothetical protein